jgi:hypothetical protein
MSEFSEKVAVHAETLKQNAGNIATYALPELPQSEANDIYERIREHESKLASRDLSEEGYTRGGAKKDDELHIVEGAARSLITAEHATSHPRNGSFTHADYGTAGLGQVLHEDLGANFIAAKGRQTGDANYDTEHPMKDAIREIMERRHPSVVTALHGFPRGKFGSMEDKRAYDAIIGIGKNPNEQSVQLAEKVRAYGDELGLKVVVNQPHVKLKDGKPILNEKGELTYMTLAASGANTTRSFDQRVAEALGYDPALLQMEMSSLLRLTPETLDQKSRVMGVYLGYLLIKNLVEQGNGLEAGI